MKRTLGLLAAPVLGRLLTRSLFLTTRVRRIDAEHYEAERRAGRPVVFVFWHGHLLPLVHHHRNEGIAVLVSEHADGEMITRVIERHGFTTARGSSTRGGVRGLKGLIRAARVGRDLAVTPDGPQGPARQFKPGALVAAEMSGAAILPLAVGITRAWRLGSWDRFAIPKPFATVTIAYGEPIQVPRGLTEDGRASVAGRVQGALDELTAKVGDAWE